jgi:hypothetical protein
MGREGLQSSSYSLMQAFDWIHAHCSKKGPYNVRACREKKAFHAALLPSDTNLMGPISFCDLRASVLTQVALNDCMVDIWYATVGP